MQTMLATGVRIKQSKKKGKIEIEYYSADDLERIVNILSAGAKVSQ